MSQPTADTPESAALPPLRQTVYWILIALAMGLMLGRVFALDSVDLTFLEQWRVARETDRWRQRFIERGLEGRRLEEAVAKENARIRDAIRYRRPFLSANDRSRMATLRALVEPEMRVPGAPYAIDKVVQEPEWDTIDMVSHSGHLYSSKPPLLPTLLAGKYWLIYHGLGLNLGEHPFVVARILLVTTILLPMLLYFWLLTRLAERLGRSDWGRVFMIGTATLGTGLTAFAVTINNHTVAVVSATVALFALARIWLDGERRLRYFALAGFFAAFMVANEFPAAALAGLMSLMLLVRMPRETLMGFLPGALVVVVPFFATNYIAHDTWKPPYAHPEWYDYEYERQGRIVESYWRDPQGVDRGEPSPARYAFHVLIGHHGIFSLTPVWLLAFAGMGAWLCCPPEKRLRDLAMLALVISLVGIGFYLVQPQSNRNYGGVTSFFRWVFWLTPVWLVMLLPAADWMARRRWSRGLALLLLAASAVAVAYPTWNPWTHPYLFEYLHYLGWVRL